MFVYTPEIRMPQLSKRLFSVLSVGNWLIIIMLLYHQMSCDACMTRCVCMVARVCVYHCVSYYIKGVLIREVQSIHVYTHEHVPRQLECSFLISSPFPCRDWCIWRTLSEGTEGHTATWSSPPSCVLTWDGRWAIVDLVHLSSIQRPHELPVGNEMGNSSKEGTIQQWHIYYM